MGVENVTEVRNEAGGIAHKMEPFHALAQYALTGCLNQTFYVTAEAQAADILKMCETVGPEFVAKTAVFARQKGHMKDVPALLVVWLAAKRETDLLTRVFSRVIDNGKMLRNFVKLLRSGVTGRKSLGSVPKRLVGNWFNTRTAKEVFSQSVGGDPSFRDVLRLSHPKPLDRAKNSLYRWLLGKDYVHDDLPSVVRDFEDFKSGNVKEVPDVPFEMLTALNLGQAEWCQIALRAGWHWTRMNLNTLQRHGVFGVPEMVEMVAKKLTDREAIKQARVFPYQLLAAYKNTGTDIPYVIREALQDALEIATENVNELPGDGFIAVDVSGSMNHSVTGSRLGSTSKVRCVDVAGLLASAILRKNPGSCVIPFENGVRQHNINPRDSVMTNADKLGNMVGGGTNCAAPLVLLNEKHAKGDWVVLVSDNQSWVDSLNSRGPHTWNSRYNNSGPGHTRFMAEWDIFRERNPQARLVCLDIQPYTTTQTQTRDDILNVGGFSDTCFDVVNMFLRDELAGRHWASLIGEIEL